MKTLKNLLLVLVTLFSVNSFSQTTHTINLTDPGFIDTITVQVNDVVDIVNSASNYQFSVTLDGVAVPGYNPTGNITNGSTIYSKTPSIDVDFDLTVQAVGNPSAAVFLHVIVEQTSVGVDEVSDINFSVFPNPTTDFLNVSGDNIETVKVFNMNGQMVVSETYNSNSVKVDVTNLNNGFYMLFVNDRKPIRFVKN